MLRRPAWSGPLASGVVPAVPGFSALRSIDAEWAWGGSAGTGVKVAVIDSGIDASHPAIGRPPSGYVTVQRTASGLSYDPAPHDDAYGHGTIVSGLVLLAAPSRIGQEGETRQDRVALAEQLHAGDDRSSLI